MKRCTIRFDLGLWQTPIALPAENVNSVSQQCKDIIMEQVEHFSF